MIRYLIQFLMHIFQNQQTVKTTSKTQKHYLIDTMLFAIIDNRYVLSKDDACSLIKIYKTFLLCVKYSILILQLNLD